MMSSSATRTLTVRLKPEIYAAAAEIARERQSSLNALVQEGLLAMVRDAEARARYDAYTLLGADTEGCDVDYALVAQSEVVLTDEA